MIPLLSRVQDDKPRFRALYMQTAWLLAFVTVPGVAALTCTSEQVVNILFGAKWQAITPIFVVAGLGRRGQSVNNTSGWVFICQGKPGSVPVGRVRLCLRRSLPSSSGCLGRLGVASAYAISGYVLRVPVLAVLSASDRADLGLSCSCPRNSCSSPRPSPPG